MLRLINLINIKNNFINAKFLNNKYYFLNKTKEIYIYNQYLNLESIKKTEYQFINITFNNKINKFVASTKDSFNRLYILNENFEIISVFDLKIPTNLQNKISDLYFDKETISYTITTNSSILKIDENGNFEKLISKNHNIVSTLNNYVTLNINNSLFLCKISKNGNIIQKIYIDDDINPKIIKVSNKYLELLSNNYIYKYIIIANELIELNLIYDTEKNINNYINNILKKIKFDTSVKNINYLIELEKISNKNINLLSDISKNLRL